MVGFWCADVMISIWSPLFNSWFNGTSFPFTRVPLVLIPISEWILKAKSKDVAPLASDLISPLGVNTRFL